MFRSSSSRERSWDRAAAAATAAEIREPEGRENDDKQTTSPAFYSDDGEVVLLCGNRYRLAFWMGWRRTVFHFSGGTLRASER